MNQEAISKVKKALEYKKNGNACSFSRTDGETF